MGHGEDAFMYEVFVTSQHLRDNNNGAHGIL